MKGFSKKIFKKSLTAMLAFVMVLATFAIPGGVKVQAAPAQPFGLVVSCPSDNTIGVVWGRGDINSYNVYIDNAKVASNVGCAYYEYKGYSAGSHTVSVTTVNGGEESARTTETVNVTGSSNSSSSSSSSVATGDVVTVYADANYSGASANLPIGQYTLADLQRLGISNDSITSIKLPLGYKVTVFQDDNFAGSNKVYSDTQPQLVTWNDRISSIIIEEAKYYIVNKHSGLVLDIEGNNRNNGGNIIQWTKNGGNNQQFKAVRLSSGHYKLVSALHGKVMDVDNNSKDNGANVHMWDDNGGANQQWTIDFVDGAYAYIISRNSGKSLDADDWGTVAGGNVIQWQLGTMQANQLWKFELANTGAAKPSGSTGTPVNTPTTSGDLPQIPNLEARSDRMYLKLNNKTNGKYPNNQVYWCILGYNSNNELCYVDKNGNLIKATAGMNTISKNGRLCADICYTLAEKDYVYLPDIVSGRMYLSYGEQVYITFNVAADGRVGYAGPDLNNATDPNQDVFFEFIEFTVKNKEYWGNTTRVDFYSFPVVTRLIGTNGYTNGQYYANFDRTVGDLGTREEIFNTFKNEVPDEFDTLVTDMRIMAPCKLTFNEGARYANYYDAYINEFWNKYSTQDLVFTCQAGTFRGRVEGDRMRFTKDGDGGTYYVYKPTTQDVLEGKGNFNRGNSTELVIEAQLCAAFNRGVATQPENYNNASAFYKNSVSNFYSGFWHNHSYDRYAYGFCYDDVNDHSTLLHFTNPTGLIIDLKW